MGPLAQLIMYIKAKTHCCSIKWEIWFSKKFHSNPLSLNPVSERLTYPLLPRDPSSRLDFSSPLLSFFNALIIARTQIKVDKQCIHRLSYSSTLIV